MCEETCCGSLPLHQESPWYGETEAEGAASVKMRESNSCLRLGVMSCFLGIAFARIHTGIYVGRRRRTHQDVYVLKRVVIVPVSCIPPCIKESE